MPALPGFVVCVLFFLLPELPEGLLPQAEAHAVDRARTKKLNLRIDGLPSATNKPKLLP
jgi:hypothetical protein